MKIWLKVLVYTILFSGIVVILFLSNSYEKDQKVTTPIISIKYNSEDAILTENEIIYRLKLEGYLINNQKFSELNMEAIEKFILDMPEVKNCNVYRELGLTWNINIELRKIIARIIDKNGKHFYIDDEGFILERKSNIVCRVPIFTGKNFTVEHVGFIGDIINKDSLISNKILQDIYAFSNYVCYNPFLQALIAQVQVDKNGHFMIVPEVGDYIIKFGAVESNAMISDKFFRLENFYKKGIPYEGWNKYKEINLNYDGQIVCRKK